eukprot:14146952-Alexandrium_andersonii.AAC.1
MSASLVGSEMCIRDRFSSTRKETCSDFTLPPIPKVPAFNEWWGKVQHAACAASIFPNHALDWITRVETSTLSELASS